MNFGGKLGFSSKIMRNDWISSGFSVKILSNDVIHHIHVFMVIKNITNLHKLICIYANISFVFHCFYSYVFYCFNWFFVWFF